MICDYTASFPSITPRKDTAFDIFVREEDEGKMFVKRTSTLAGETDAVEFTGSVTEESDGLGSRFSPPILSQSDALTHSGV